MPQKKVVTVQMMIDALNKEVNKNKPVLLDADVLYNIRILESDKEGFYIQIVE